MQLTHLIPIHPVDQRKRRALLLSIFATFTIFLANSIFLHVRAAIRHPERTDVSAYYAGIQIKAAGIYSMYDREASANVGRSKGIPGGARPYIYPPTFAEALLPFSTATFHQFRLAWIVITHLFLFLLFAATITLVTEVISFSKGIVAIVTFFVFVSYSPIEREIFYGQASIMSASLLYWALLADRRGYPLLAGFFAAVGTHIKIYPVVLLAVFLLCKRFKALTASLAWIIVIFTGSAVLFGIQDWTQFLSVHSMARSTAALYHAGFTYEQILESPNYSPLHFLYLASRNFGFSTDPLRLAYLSKIMLAGGILTYLAIFRMPLRRTGSPLVVTQLVLIGMLLTSPVLWNHVYILILPGFVYAGCLILKHELEMSYGLVLLGAFALIAIADYGPNISYLNYGPLVLVKPLKLYGLLMYLIVYTMFIQRHDLLFDSPPSG